MKHQALARVFAVVLAIMCLLMLLNGATGFGKAAKAHEERTAFEEKYAQRIENYVTLHEQVENSISYDEAYELLKEKLEQHDKDAAQHRTDTALYTAEKGEGAFLNGKRVFCRERPADRAIISFGDFSHRRPDDLTDEHRVMFYLSPRVSKIRMFGSAAVDFALLVTGRIDGTMFFTKLQWDIAPGALLTREAGGVVTSFEGDYTLDSRAVVAASCENIARLIKESW